MCTVTFIARKRGYALGMNRDEKIARVKGLAPKQRTMNGVKVLCPSEPGGGTWIALNETGVTIALINWYSVSERVKSDSVSRGEVVLACSHAVNAAEAEAALARLPLRCINPFRLIGIFPREREAVEWRWNLRKLERVKHSWRAQQWISSGHDEPKAQRIRSQTFRRAKERARFGSIDWLRGLHRSHGPARGPFSTCMHRAEAETVSYTEVRVTPQKATLRYVPIAPCGGNILPVHVGNASRENASLLDLPISVPAFIQGKSAHTLL